MPRITHLADEQARGAPARPTLTWIDVDIDDPPDRAWLAALEDLSIQTRALLEEPVRLSHREHLDEGLLLSLRTLQTGAGNDIEQLADLRILVGKTQLLTVHAGPVAAVDELSRYAGTAHNLVTPVDLLAWMIAGMTRRMEVIIFDMVRLTDSIEDQLLDDGVIPAPEQRNDVRRRIIRTRRQLNSVEQMLASIATDPVLPLDPDDRETLIRSSNHVTRYLASVEDCRARVEMLEDQIEAQRASMMTRASLNLTVVATVFLPLTFISGLLGMNVAGIPDEHNPWAFWIVSGVCLVLAVVIWVLLQRRMRY